MAEYWEMDSSLLEAKEVYVLMQNNYRISRNIRAQWFFKNLNKTLTFKWKTCQLDCTDEIEVISAIPKCSENFKVDSATNSSSIKIVPDTLIHFLSTQYRLVFCLDLSTSVATIDVQHDSIHFGEIYSSLEQSLRSLSEPFFVPGSRFFFIPQIIITVIAHIPNCSLAAPQVLIQGWILIPESISYLLECLKEKLMAMCKLVKNISASVQEEQIQFMMPHDASGAVIDGIIDGKKMIKKVLDLSADISTLKIIRYGILALQLLPENSSAGIVVITDGIISFPNCKSLDSLLTQLRNSTIACSFLQLGSPFYPYSSFGRVPYKELMEFISTATCGAYFPSSADIVMESSRVNEINVYHQALLFWNFQKTATSYFLEAYEPSMKTDNYWHIENPHFYTVAHQSRVRKKHTEGTLKVSLENLLSCRLREGYSVKSVLVDDAKNSTEVRLVLPWMLSTNIEYIITSVPGRKSAASDISSCHFEVIVDGCYEFLHDVTCSDKKPIKSLYRKTVIAQFWSYIKNLSNTDQILMQLHSFSHNPVYYTIPDSIKNGVPLFYFPSNSSMPVLFSKNVANMQFTSFWKPLCMLDINVWQKWMHAHRIGIILQHDMPLPKNLHLPNSSGRYVHVQCRQATAALNSLLSEHSSFTLVENHSYIKLLFDDSDKPPFSFYVIRVTSKPPCVVIRLAFLGGLPGRQRYEIVSDLRQKILNMKRATSKDSQSCKQLSSNPLESCCCFLLKKPVEKILIRYEKLPANFLISVPDNQYSPRGIGTHKHSDSYLYADALITLSKYLQQQRWLWTLQYQLNTSLALTSASKILYTLTNIRLEEGFRFSQSGSGVIYMVQEFPVQVFHGEPSDQASPADTNCCVVQYILFPPHTNTTLRDSTSDDDDNIELAEADGELQLITECWVEPQLGITVLPKLKYLDGLKFSEISNTLQKRDVETVTVLTTFEHLSTLCEKNVTLPCEILPIQSTGHSYLQTLHSSPSGTNLQENAHPLQENISVIPYCFDLLSLLPKCPQTEIVVSALHGDFHDVNEDGTIGNDMLFNFFIENIRSLHNHEVALNLEDSLIFPFLIHHRHRNSEENPVPFPHPEANMLDISTLNRSFLSEHTKLKTCCHIGDSISELSDCSRRPLLYQAAHKEEYIPKWRCFVKGCSSNQVILTIIPASYNDLKKLYPQGNSDLPDNSSELPKMNASQEESCLVESNEDAEDATINSKESKIDSVSVAETSMQDNVDQINVFPDLLYIPLYVYNAVSSSITSLLVYPDQCENIEDNFLKYTFEYENCIDEQSNISSGHLVLPTQYNDETEKQKRPKKDSHYFNIRNHCSLIEKSYSKAFIYSVYRSLLLSNPVHKFDAVAAIDEICEENLLEVDITEFVSMICGHVKDFTTKRSVHQMHLADDDKKKLDVEESVDNSTDTDRVAEKCLFPISVLQKHQPCEHLQQKHLNIKEKFVEIIKSFFKAIPSRPDYFYFNHEEDTEEASVRVEEEESHEEDDLKDESYVEFGGDFLVNENDKASFPEDEVSAKSFNIDSLSSFDKDTEPGSDSEKKLYPPLFVHFSCSVRRNKQIKSCPLSSLPTCLNDVISCFDSECSEIDLEDLRVTLDITCLTVPNDIENLDIERQRMYSTSFSSSSPVPETDFYRKQPISEDNDESDSSDMPSDTLQGGTLQNLSSYQRESVLSCMDKIKWLLQDEKASVSLNSFPITSEILDMVVKHVKSSNDKPCCIIKEIPLMFIYGSDSLNKFIQAFKRMSPVGYRLESVNDVYYLVLDAESAKKLNCPFGSLEPPLGIADKFQIIKRNPHSNDHTELKKIAEEMKDSPMFLSHDSSFQQQQHSDGLNDDFKPSKANSVTLLNFLRDKGSRKFQQDDDTDTEDGNDVLRPKLKFHRKTSKKYDTFPQSSKRTHSTPSFGAQDKKTSPNERPSTAPPKLFVLESDLQGEHSSWNLPKSKKRKYSTSENIESWANQVQTGSPLFGSSPDPCDESKNLPLTSSVTSVNRFRPPDSIGSPVMYSEAECGSFPFSNTEDGYDGDSSDTGSDLNWLSAVDTRRPVLPNFWMIMNVCHSKVVVYFHMRDRSDDDLEFIQCKEVLSKVISIVTNICKEVNQVLLLLSLCETRKCNRLLVPEDNEDVWKNRDLNQSLPVVPNESQLEVQEKYLEATLKVEPGAFSCPVVWVAHFKLHHRLTMHQSGQTKSQGLQALRSVLSTFSVVNRENMFVYQEDTGSVFYIRLYEENCDESHYSGTPKPEDNSSLIGSCCSSLQSIPQKKIAEFDTETEFRPRVNSGASDSYRQDSISTTSASRKVQKCVSLYVHGIGEAGTPITHDLIEVLQNRLNDSLLDIIIGMLSRNPQCMLTPEDVQFIQNPSSFPTYEIHFTLPVKLLGYAHSIHIYLRQNMLHFLYNPKYTDNRAENHFKAFSSNPMEWSQVDDNDIFLHYSKPASGQPGGKGISCIVLSLVTGQGAPYQNYSNLLPNPSAYQDGFSESEFEDLTATALYKIKKDKSPGPVALIQFHVWTVGKDSLSYLEQQLEGSVRQALWDLLMEYKALTSPISDTSFLDDSSCYSEPTTPIKIRRSGLAGIDFSTPLKDFHVSTSLQTTKEISSSVPDITTKAHSPPSLLKEISTFKFGSGPQSAKPEFHTEAPKSQPSPTSSKVDKRNLNSMYHSLLKPFLEFGVTLECPSLFKKVYTLPSRQCVFLVTRDIQSILKSVSRDNINIYIEDSSPVLSTTEFIPFNPYPKTNSAVEDSKPGFIKNFIIIGRNELQWKTYMGNYDFLKYHESNIENMKAYQKFQTHICCIKNPEPSVDSVPSSPTWTTKQNAATASSPQSKNSITCASDRLTKSTAPSHFVPRQRMLVMFVEDTEITAYFYNWPQDVTCTLLQKLARQICWHLQRNCLLKNIILQKLGIFHGLIIIRVEKDSSKDDRQSTVKSPKDEPTISSPATIEQLIHNHSLKETHTPSTSSKSVIKSGFHMRSLKNLKPHVPFHLSTIASIKDPLTAHGLQYLDAISTQRRDMQVLYNMWHSRGSSVNYPSDRVFTELKHSARLSHYCLTPILFSPSWRWKVAPIRDHALEPLDQNLTLTERTELIPSRSRHSSGNSLKNVDIAVAGGTGAARYRRLSGSTVNPNSNQNSPKLRMKTPSEETWHSTVCRDYLQEYVQYLHSLGFVSLQTSDTTSLQSRRSGGEEDKLSRSDSFSRRHGRRPPVFNLIKCLLGGLLVFEVGLSEPYAYGHLYSVEASRFKACNTRTLNSQFITAFLDELDKVKLHMHLHSFTYDYHLRTIHSYISGRQLIFKHGYHLTSFLDDFIKYYQKAPTGAHNLLLAGSLTITDINISASQLYNYIISHNQLYGMTVLRMVPVIIDTSSSIDTEFALVELSAQKASYKDFNDVLKMGNFDFGLLINQNTTEATPDNNALILNFYLILTSQRDLYPKLPNFGTALGSFQTVRYGSVQTSLSSSRKTSNVSMVTMTEKDKFESSGEDSVNSTDSRSKRIMVVHGMCDEDVTYLGYYSSQETLIQQVLQEQAEAAQNHLNGVVHRAAVHCRRDSLWSNLLPRSLKDENSMREHSLPSPSSYADFTELLDMVINIPLWDADEKLTPFTNMNIVWYVNLAPVLKAKYADSHREYKSPDGNSIHVVVTNNQCPDSFLLLTVDVQINKAELSVVFRERPEDTEHVGGEPNLRTLALHSLIEGFVNACCFHLWSSML